MHSHIGCNCLTFLHHVQCNLFYTCTTFFHCLFLLPLKSLDFPRFVSQDFDPSATQTRCCLAQVSFQTGFVLFFVKTHTVGYWCHTLSGWGQAPVGWKWKWSSGVWKSEMSIFWCISMTKNVKSCKEFNENAQLTTSVFLQGDVGDFISEEMEILEL